MIIFASLPDELDTRLLDQVEMLQHTFVDGAGTQTAAHQQDGFLLWVQTEALDCFLAGDSGFQQRLPDRISRHDNLLGWEETLHSIVGHADFLRFLGQQFIGHSCIRILLLYETGYAHRRCLIERRAAGVTADTYCSHGTKILDDLLGHALALPNLQQHREVLQQVLPVEATNGQSFDLVSGCWHTLHFHATQCSHKQYFCLGTFGLNGIGY